MSRKVHQAISDNKHTYAIIETASSSAGREWGIFVNLNTVKVENQHIDQLEAYRLKGNPLVEVLSSKEVDARNQGPRSRYGKALKDMLEQLPDRVAGDEIFNSGVRKGYWSSNLIEEVKLVDKVVERRHALGAIAAKVSQEEDLATADQALAARQRRGRVM